MSNRSYKKRCILKSPRLNAARLPALPQVDDEAANDAQAATTDVNLDRLKTDLDKFFNNKNVKSAVAGIEGYVLASQETWTGTHVDALDRFNREVAKNFRNGSETLLVDGEAVQTSDIVDTFVSEAKRDGYIVMPAGPAKRARRS